MNSVDYNDLSPQCRVGGILFILSGDLIAHKGGHLDIKN